MSKKKGQKHQWGSPKPMNLRALSLLPIQDRKAIARKIELKSGSQVWWDEAQEILVGTNTWDASKGEYVQDNKVLRTGGGYEGGQEQYLPLPEETVPVVWKKPQS